VIDYNFVEKDTFNSPHALECRGLKFAADGQLIARPFHKFFNLGEKQSVDDVDFTAPHRVLEKRDGSMIHPCWLEGELVFMTRKGQTPHADLARAHADAGILSLCCEMLEEGITPIFEFTSPENRVVVAYEGPELVLLAARHMISGAYLPWEVLTDHCARHNVPLVQAHDPVDDAHRFTEAARALRGTEGYVIAFENGHRIKLKADAYVLRHKALDGLKYEKNVLAWIVEGAVDDVSALLKPEDRDRLLAYSAAVESSIARHATELETFHAANRDLPRKAYALKAQADLDHRLTRVAFALLDGRPARAELLKIVQWATHSENRPPDIRDLLGATWEAPDLSNIDD
jgi:RNA ligase